MKIGFMGTPHFSKQILEIINNSKHELCHVWCQPPSKSGRGKKLTPCLVEQYCIDNNIEYSTPSVLGQNDIEIINNKKIDVVIVVAYGIILKQEIFDNTNAHFINGHPSSLPKYRGAAPIERTIQNDNENMDICIIKMNKYLDAGDILCKKTLNINNKYMSEIYPEIINITADLCIECIENNNFVGEKQNEGDATYAKKIQKHEMVVNWNLCANEIFANVRAFDMRGYMNTKINGIDFKIVKMKILENKSNHNPGVVVSTLPFVVSTKNFDVEILTVKKPGKGEMDIKSFMNGVKINQGDTFD